MTGEAGLKHKFFEKHLIEWTVATPAVDCGLDSCSFMMQNISCCLRLMRSAENGGVFRLYFYSNSVSKITRMEVDLYSGTRSMPRRKSILELQNSCIWTCSTDEMLKFIPNIQNGHLLRFELYIQYGDIPKEEKSVQTLTHADSHVYFESLSRDYESLFEKLENDPSHDVEIKCEDHTFNSHKLVLSARSEVFAAMLQSGMVEGKTGKVKIDDMEASVLKPFLRYLYSGKLPELSVDTAKQLYVSADKYAVQGLRKQCDSFLVHNLSDGNACDILVLADSHNDLELKEKVLMYILEQNLPKKKDLFSGFAHSHPALAVEVYERYVA